MKDNTAFPILKQRSIGTSKNPILNWGQSSKDQPASTSVRSLYIHIPFCFHKCHYCDFYSIVDRQDRQEAFVERIVQEIRSQASATNHPNLETIFIGGGTPTLLAPPFLRTLLNAIKAEFQISNHTEWTIESNPETFTDEICEVLAESPVNRISTGAQSFNRDHLKTLERHHDPESVARSILKAKAAGFEHISLDLIYGIPDQTLDQWADDLKQAFTLPIDHISAYALTYEPNTAMTMRLNKGEFTPTPDELEVEMYNHTLDQIRAHGFARYEVSNHAKPGSECRHNLAYWQGHNWLAIGPSASGHLDGIRWKNTPRLDEYLNTSDQGFAPICELESPDPKHMLMDWMMMGIRVRAGLSIDRLMNESQMLRADERIKEIIESCTDLGWTSVEENHLQLTDPGFHYADRVARELIGALTED